MTAPTGSERPLSEKVAEVLGAHDGFSATDGHMLCLCGAEVVGPWFAHADGWSHRTHVAEALAPVLAEHMAGERAAALREAAEAVAGETEGIGREGTAGWDERDRDLYSLAIEEARGAIRARADREAKP